MAKTIIKEMFITLLVIIAVLLILGIIFYKYIPNNRIIPAKVQAYSTPEKVTKEIEESAQEELEEEEKIYSITDADLTQFKNEKSYNPGKVNPFKDFKEDADSNQSSEPQSPTTPQTDQNTTDNYYTASGVGSGTK